MRAFLINVITFFLKVINVCEVSTLCEVLDKCLVEKETQPTCHLI